MYSLSRCVVYNRIWRSETILLGVLDVLVQIVWDSC